MILKYIFVYRIVQSNEAQAVIKRYENFVVLLREFEEKLFLEWANVIPSQIERNMKHCLLARSKNNSDLLLNFHPQVILSFNCRYGVGF